MTIKRTLSLLTALVLWLTAAGTVLAEEPEYPDELRVGHTTITKGDFFTEMAFPETG